MSSVYKIAVNFFAILVTTCCAKSNQNIRYGDHVVKDGHACLGSYGLIELSNLSLHAKFCHQHAGRTCCGKEDTLRIKQSYAAVVSKGEVSRQCLALMQDAVCGACDPDIVGIRVKLITIVGDRCCRWVLWELLRQVVPGVQGRVH